VARNLRARLGGIRMPLRDDGIVGRLGGKSLRGHDARLMEGANMRRDRLAPCPIAT